MWGSARRYLILRHAVVVERVHDVLHDVVEAGTQPAARHDGRRHLNSKMSMGCSQVMLDHCITVSPNGYAPASLSVHTNLSVYTKMNAPQ